MDYFFFIADVCYKYEIFFKEFLVVLKRVLKIRSPSWLEMIFISNSAHMSIVFICMVYLFFIFANKYVINFCQILSSSLFLLSSQTCIFRIIILSQERISDNLLFSCYDRYIYDDKFYRYDDKSLRLYWQSKFYFMWWS